MGWGSSTRLGGGRKVCALPRKFVFLEFRREESWMSREFCWDVPDAWECSKSWFKNVRAHFSFPTSVLRVGVRLNLFAKKQHGLLIANLGGSQHKQAGFHGGQWHMAKRAEEAT